jgi:uncharacterized protein YcaQ
MPRRMTTLPWDAVLAWRTARHGLVQRAPASALLDVVARLCGVHAQVASCAELALWARLEGLPRGAVDRLLWEERALVKTWAMRGTLHLLPAAQLPRYVAALSRLRPRHHQPTWLRHHGLAREEAAAMVAAVPVVLDGALLYGPAPREQFQRWFGMTSPAEAGRWLRALGDEVEDVEVDGTRGWMLAADVAEAAAAAPTGVVRLLPGFDPYVVGAPRGQDAVLAGNRRDRVYRAQGWLSPVLLVDGRIVGVWSHERRGGRLHVEVDAFARPHAALRTAVEAEVERLAAFLGGAAALRWLSG